MCLGEETIVDDIAWTSRLRENREIAQRRRLFAISAGALSRTLREPYASCTRIMHVGKSRDITIIRGKSSLLLFWIINICNCFCHAFLTVSWAHYNGTWA